MLLQDESHRVDSLFPDRVGHLTALDHRFHPQAQHHRLRSLLLLGAGPQHRRVPFVLASSCFLSTPKTQWKDMWKETRWLLTLCYLGFLILTLVLAFVLPDNLKVLVIVSMILQMISYFLYTLSYVPFGRKLIKRFCKCLFSEE